MENIKTITPRGFEEALRYAPEVPTINKIPEIVSPDAISVPAPATDNSKDRLGNFILAAFILTVGIIVYNDIMSTKKKQQEQ